MRSALRRLLLLAATVAPATLPAQRAAAHDSRLAAFKAASDSALIRLQQFDDSVRGANARLDTIVVGPLHLQVEPSLVPLATRAAQAALDSLRPGMGTTIDRLRRYLYVLRVERFTRWNSDRPDSNVVVEAYDRAGPPLMNIRQRYDTALVASAIRMYAPFLVVRDASPSLVGWMGGFVSLDSLTREDWRTIRFSLVSSRAVVARRCYAGDVPACSVALQFTTAADPVREWYDARDRQLIVKRSENVALRINGLSTKHCLDGDDLSCITLLRRYPPASLPEPMGLQARTTLVRLAVHMGGAGAVERLLDGDQSPLERLSIAARMPVDSVIQRWQTSARTLRSSSRDLSAQVVLGALFWSLALGALSLRSSRWR